MKLTIESHQADGSAATGERNINRVSLPTIRAASLPRHRELTDAQVGTCGAARLHRRLLSTM